MNRCYEINFTYSKKYDEPDEFKSINVLILNTNNLVSIIKKLQSSYKNFTISCIKDKGIIEITDTGLHNE